MRKLWLTKASMIFLVNLSIYIQRSVGHPIGGGSSSVGHEPTHVLDAPHLPQSKDNHTMFVQTAMELREALSDGSIGLIIVTKDMNLTWYNGWGGGSVFSGHKIFRSTNVTLSSVPGAADKPMIDIDGRQLLGSLVTLDGITLKLSGLFLKNVQPVQPEALDRDLPGTQVIIEDCIIELRGPHQLLSRTLVQGLGDSENTHAYGRGDCAINGQRIDCADGGVMVKSLEQPVSFMGDRYLTEALNVTNTLFIFEEHQYRFAAGPVDLGKYMEENDREDIFINLPGNSMDMVEAASCKTDSPVHIKHDVVVDSRMEDIGATFFKFHQESECLTLGASSTLHFKTIIVDECATQGHFKQNFLPFFIMEENSRIILEGTVISVVPNSHSTTSKQIKSELQNAAINGHKLNITDMTIEDFYLNSGFIEALFETPKSTGFLVEHAVIQGQSGSEVHLVHSLFIVDDSFFSDYGKRLKTILGITCACILGVILLGGFALWHRRYKPVFGTRFDHRSFAPDQNEALLGGVTVGEELTILTRSPKNHNMHREHQEVANKLMEALTLGNLIGRGGFGQVYKATWNGAIVAVKVIFHREHIVSADEDVAREAALSSDLRHPNVVQTFMQATRIVTETSDKASSTQSNVGDDAAYVGIRNLNSGSDSFGSAGKNNNCAQECPSLQHKETWLVQEFCDLGSLGHSLQLKLLDRCGERDMNTVLHTCLDIARGMQYLHDRNVIHGDLKCTNVLLCSSTQSQRGFVAKVADFGLSRQLAVNVTHISTNTVGTLTHMPPELLKGRKLVPKADVYSFGIMMWEILMGRSPFAGWTAPQLLRAVVNDKWRPAFPADAPHGFNELGIQCLMEEPQDRPAFAEITKRLDKLRVLYASP